MSGFFQDLLNGFAASAFGSEYLRDYRHAAKTFQPNAYQYAPKLKFLFHTYFDINPQAYEFDEFGAQLTATGQNFGLLVREIKLPSYNFQTEQLNQYNRKRIIQTKIKYDPVTVTFHDDNSSLVTKLWAAYYTYYYADGNNPKVIFAGSRGDTDPGLALGNNRIAGNPSDVRYNDRNIYDPSITGEVTWGYSGGGVDSFGTGQPRKIPFFKNITVFGFNQKNFIAYTLVNPIITAFNHDTYNYDEGNGTMRNVMTLDYETVVYNEGAIDGRAPGDIVTGFGDPATYDTQISPLDKPGANGAILGKGGLVDAAGGFISGITSGNLGGVLKGIQAAGTAYNTYKDKNLLKTGALELQQMLKNTLNQNPNSTRNLIFDFANPSAGPGTAGNAGAPTIDATTSPTSLNRRGGELVAPELEIPTTTTVDTGSAPQFNFEQPAGAETVTGFYNPPPSSEIFRDTPPPNI